MALFQPGHPGYKTAGSIHGRKKVLNLFDKIIGDEGRLDKLRIALIEAFDKNPLSFYKQYIFPLLPKDFKIELETAQKLPIRIILGNENDKLQETTEQEEIQQKENIKQTNE